VLGAGTAVASILLSRIPPAQEGFLLGLTLLSIAAIHSRRVWGLLPERTRQVSGTRLSTTPSVAAVAFPWGFELGVGIMTFLVTPAFYGLIAVASAERWPLGSVTVGVAYGASRGLTIAAMSLLMLRRARRNEEREAAVGMARATRWPFTFLLVLIAAALILANDVH
jgi:hypothetical protein